MFLKKITLLAIGVILFTALALSGCRPGGNVSELEARVTQLEQDNAALQAEKNELQSKVETLEAENEELRQGGTTTPVPQISRKPRSGWEQYFPTAETTTLQGETTDRVRELLGEPPYLIRSIAVNTAASREIWIFTPYDEDPTGLYLFFKGGTLDSSRQDEFGGLYGSGLLDLDPFWLQ